MWTVSKIQHLASGRTWLLHCTWVDEDRKIFSTRARWDLWLPRSKSERNTLLAHALFTPVPSCLDVEGLGVVFGRGRTGKNHLVSYCNFTAHKIFLKAFLRVSIETFLDSQALNHTTGPIIFLGRNNISSDSTFFVLIGVTLGSWGAWVKRLWLAVAWYNFITYQNPCHFLW